MKTNVIEIIKKNFQLLKTEEDKNTYDNTNFPIELSDKEQECLINHLKGKKHYLEYGSGGSTFLALLNTDVPKITSIESDKNWIKYLEKWDIIRENEHKRLNFQIINIGKTGKWGKPIEYNKMKLFPQYSLTAFKKNKDYDIIFIDGRFRVACAIQSILNCGENAEILIHDFTIRAEYHCLLRFLDVIETQDTLAVFKVKSNYKKKALAELYEAYKYNFE